MVDITVSINSNDLRCPITGEILFEPVVASDGHIYEKQALETWLSNNNKSPMTREIINKCEYSIQIFYKKSYSKSK